ncbi:PspA/IM30 family protein [Candidatus Poribacteria bacterium]|nr:PspA/IM30 family protein [Candidatus Poribacteria bacterium]
MKRIKGISEQVRESITQFLEAVEGPESFLNAAIHDMKKRLAEAKELVATAIAEEQRLKRAYQEAVDAAKVWDTKADTAEQEGNQARVSEARQRTQQYMTRADGYKHQIDAQAAVVARLKSALHEFYQQFRDAAEQAEELRQRQKQAETHTELYQVLSDEVANGVSEALERMEQKLKTTEAKAKNLEGKSRQTITRTEMTEDSLNLDQVLAELKDDVLGSGRK